MSEATLRNLIAMCDSIDQNTALVNERMLEAGMCADPVIVESMAKYWIALERLAAE